MTAVLIDRPAVSLPCRCRKRWCLNVNGCASDTPGTLRYHEGRTNTVSAGRGGRIDVTPCAFDTQDWKPFGTPSVTVALYSEDGARADIDLKTSQARRLAAVIAEFVDGDAPVGAEMEFAGRYAEGQPSGATLIVRRIADAVCEVGSGGPRYITLKQVALSGYAADCDEVWVTLALLGNDAAALAKTIGAAAVEVEDCPPWCTEDTRSGPDEVVHVHDLLRTWHGEDPFDRLRLGLTRSDDADGIGDPWIDVQFCRTVSGAQVHNVYLPLTEAQSFVDTMQTLIRQARAEVAA